MLDKIESISKSLKTKIRHINYVNSYEDEKRIIEPTD